MMLSNLANFREANLNNVLPTSLHQPGGSHENQYLATSEADIVKEVL